jgi:dolichol-phosphate mannosyltransferase
VSEVGLATFYAACSIGAAVNLAISEQLLRHGLPWLAAWAGLAVRSVWNY